MYQNEVWCDIILMDACLILLGKPCYYDLCVTHDGYGNAYSFVKDGMKIKLTLLPPKEFNQAKGEAMPLVSLVSKNQFKVTSGSPNHVPYVIT